MKPANSDITTLIPDLFQPHPNFSDTVNANIVRSEIEGGVHVDRLDTGETLEVRTRNHTYTIVSKGNGAAMISGHPRYCPEPVLVRIVGSNWGGSMLKALFIGRGMHLEFSHPEHRSIVTSPVVEIQARPAA